MARYWCQRCKAESNTLDPPHLCADLRVRYERQAKAIEMIEAIVEEGRISRTSEDIAIEVLTAISGRDLGI